MTSGRGRCPFTALQWEELEHQALIFKYMVTGMPIPPDLLFAVKRTGWSYLQMGLGRKVDPEPGRCRRTDGKKWRCSRDAFPDSKYCERHMHRGKNRSRKHVEAMTPPTPASNAPPPPPPPGNCLSSALLNPRPSSPASHSLSQLSSVTNEPHRPDLYGYGHPRFSHAHLENHLALPHSSSRPAEQVNTVHSLMDSSGSWDPDYRRSGYVHGGLREADERTLTEHSRPLRNFSNPSPDDPLQLTPLTMGTSFSKQSTPSGLAHGRGVEFSDHSQLRRLADASKQREDPHCYLLGRDLKCQTPAKVEGVDENQKGVHRLFDDWAAPKGREPWLDTQLSMSIPDSSHDFPIFHSRTHNDGLGFQ